MIRKQHRSERGVIKKIGILTCQLRIKDLKQLTAPVFWIINTQNCMYSMGYTLFPLDRERALAGLVKLDFTE